MFYQPNGAGIPAPTRVALATLVFLIGAAFALPAVATTVAGRTAGSFAVSSTGAATYTIPIWAPPGPQGMQPNVALVYNSQLGVGGGGLRAGAASPAAYRCSSPPAGPNGFVLLGCILNHQTLNQQAEAQAATGYGFGWTLQGLSSIYRCNLTVAQDAAAAPVSLATTDGYCMDGQRLRLTSSNNYGMNGSTYQTEVANFVNVTAHGSAGNGPAYWTATDRNGRTYTYGNGGNSQVIAASSTTASAWMLNEVSDPPGNTMTIAYNTTIGSPACVPAAPPGMAVPCTISWTPATHGSSTYNYTMNFVYAATIPQSSYYGYVAGTAVQNTNLLSSITIAYSGTTVKKYVLSYQTSPTTGRDELTQVQECSDSAGSNCFLPTAFTYQSGAIGVSTSPTQIASANNDTFVYALYDFNGDGYPDILFSNGSYWYVAFGSASGFGTPVSTGISGTAELWPGDLLGTGTDGFLADNGGTFYYYTWNGSSFTGTTTHLAVDSTGQYLLADTNGDGYPDLIEVTWTPNVALHITTRPNTSSGTSVSFGSAVDAYDLSDASLTWFNLVSATNGATTLGGLRRLDFNGDGREDLVLQTKDSTTFDGHVINLFKTVELLSNGSTFTASTIQSISESLLNLAFLNFNSDACTDFISLCSGGASLYISGCNGTAASTISLGSAVIGAMDWNGDGQTDILVANGSTIGVYLSTGNGISSLQSTSVPYSSSNTYFTASNALGDGLDALGYYTAGGAIGYYKHNGIGQPADLMSSVTDGYGNSASPTYMSLLRGNYTENGYGTPTYPDRAWTGPLYVVSEAVFSDPSSSSGGTYNQQFWYYGAWVNLQGRGWDSFYATRYLDSRNGLYYYSYYQRNFPYTGTENGRLVSNGSFYPTQWTGTLTYQTLSSTQYEQRYFPYFSNVTAYRKEVGGSENGDLVTTNSTNYTWDNYGNATTISTTVTDNDPGSPYNGNTWTTTTTNTPDVDTTHWCLGLLTETQVAYSSSLAGSGLVTRTRTMTPDTTNCRYTQVVTEPNSAQFKVTENLGYDGFGNINSDSLTGIAMGTASPATRTTGISWTSSTVTTGQFPMSVTDPSGAQTQYNYNLSYGLRSSTSDPNTLQTSWQYDGFGRKTQENRPDGTSTLWSWPTSVSCAPPYTGCGLLRNVVFAYDRDTGSNTIDQSYVELDALDRPYEMGHQNLSSGAGANDTVDVTYDSLGRLASQTAPFLWGNTEYWTTYSYDVLNRLTQSQRPISSANSNLQTTTYAHAGRTTTVTDPQSNTRTAITDVNGWLRQTKDPMGYSVTLAYDSAGSETKVTDSLGNTLWTGTYNYGLGAYLASVTDMDMGSWGFTIDALGEKTAGTDAKNQLFSETYDALSRPLTRTDPDLFTQWVWGSSASSHNIGKLQSECTGTGTSCSSSGYSESKTYDSLGRPSQRSITISGYGVFTYTWAYSATTGLLNTLTYPTSTSGYALELQYAYANGALQSVTDISDTPNVAVWTANTMDPAGHVTKEALGNGIVTNRSFDAVTQWLGTAQSGVGGGAGVKNLAFLYDEMGNVTQRQDNNLGLTENIYYDNDYRFSYSKLNGTQNLSVTYDATGNITSRSDVAGGASWTYDPNHKHEVTQAGSSAYQYSYDANGNAITRQGSTISWSSYNYPTTINAGSGSTTETVAFSYGPNRQRWQQTYVGNGTQETTNYIGGLLEVVASGGVTDYRQYINVLGEQIAVYSRKSNGTNTFSYLLSDHQASVASITNSSGAQVAGESFDAFGSRRNPTTWSGPDSNTDLTTIAGITRQGYTFQTALGLWMDLNHMNGRVQDTLTGRMLSADPTVPDATDPQSYNRFSYTNNNPLSRTDPTGFCPMAYQDCSSNDPGFLEVISGGGGAPAGGGDDQSSSDDTTPPSNDPGTQDDPNLPTVTITATDPSGSTIASQYAAGFEMTVSLPATLSLTIGGGPKGLASVLGKLSKGGTVLSAAAMAYEYANAPTDEKAQQIVIGYTVDLALGYLVATVIVIGAPETAPAYFEIAATSSAASAEMGIGASAAPAIQSAYHSASEAMVQSNVPTYTPVMCNNPFMCKP